MSLTTEYRGYTIRYDENQDAWGCYDCGVSGAKSLRQAKERIDRMHLKLRKDAAVPALEISVSDSPTTMAVSVVEATVIEFVETRYKSAWSTSKNGNTVRTRNGEREIEGYRVASVAQRKGNSKKSRQVTTLQVLAHPDPEVFEAIDYANRLGEIALAARKKFLEATKAIPRIQIEDIQGLVEAQERTLVEGEE